MGRGHGGGIERVWRRIVGKVTRESTGALEVRKEVAKLSVRSSRSGGIIFFFFFKGGQSTEVMKSRKSSPYSKALFALIKYYFVITMENVACINMLCLCDCLAYDGGPWRMQ